MTGKQHQPLLIVISAPSGAGKTTLCDRLLADYPDMRYSVSCTTRKPRTGEVDGEDYRFMDAVRFQELVKQDAFLEYAMVHGNWYGTLRETIRGFLASGFDVLLDVDVQGAARIRTYLETLDGQDPVRAGFVDIFIAPPSLDVLRDRLEGRAQDSADVVERRMQNAEREMQQAGLYTCQVVNDDLDDAYAALCRIIAAARHRHAGFS